MELITEGWAIEATTEIPLLGEVAAGQPIEMYSVEDSLDVPDAMWKGRRVFALRVRGSSMVEAGIHDGDYLIVEPCPEAENGRTVVAEIDGAVTVKKLFREKDGTIRLQPANSSMLPLVVRGESVRILGVVVGVLRKYGFEARSERSCALSSSKVSPLAPLARPAAVRKQAVPASARRVDERTLDLAVNVMDAYLERWNLVASEQKADPRSRFAVPMAEMGRDLQALREWCGRTSKASLRRAMITEAEQLMRRMDRFVVTRGITLPDSSALYH